ncbi:IPT/TIG domain-containing protein [Agreia sp. VKM Ac-1783]|uniref:IPT/TIG domain-containing protein n=1 Tax=Agreia sp. VKM Ac-1783 TaxID=1938889 RepID=UPI000A2ABFC2|nr:IPT/TIG domain-containing protein [Agreia sp. VKM Ac-1783]SMQ73471.1 IPT/TIG domain-containing protein [Agreia sp. VKM Ac-1783]
MANIAVKPRVFKNYGLKIDADNYEAHVSAVSLDPAVSTQTWKGAAPGAVFTDMGDPVWTAGLSYAQDWETPNSLSAYLLANVGKKKLIDFYPLASGPKFTVTGLIVPGSVGGAIDAFGQSTVTLGVDGQPVFLPGAVGVPATTSVTPVSGPVAGGTLVELNGSGFSGATSVLFGTVPATSFIIESDNTIFAITPAAAAGSKPAKVTTPVGVATVLGAYTFV